MNCDYLLIHYGELSTKGNNRREFISILTRNVKRALSGLSVEVNGRRDHIYVKVNGQKEGEEAVNRLLCVPGIIKISPGYECGKDVEELSEFGAKLILDSGKKTFKVEASRADKGYPLDSYGVCRLIADRALKEGKGLSVDLHHPELTLRVQVREGCCYLSTGSIKGLGGYPLGSIGKATMLLSGGIDSPVAAYSLLRRGIKIECVHFASPPYTSEAVIDKLKDILYLLTPYQSDIRLDVVPFTKIQEAIYEHVPEPYCITIMRRMMVRIAAKLASSRGSLAIASGESIGQVASQTLESMQVINEVTSFPFLRPLCVNDKVDVIDKAKEIGTFDISIRPFEDCCTIFKPRHPKTKPDLAHCLRYEALFDYEKMIEEAINGISPIFVSK